MSAATERQLQVLGFIESFLADKGFPPTRGDIARHFKFRSQNAAEDHIRALERKGYIDVHPGTARGIKVLRRPQVSRSLAGWR